MLFCKQCGNVVEKGDKFCVSCMTRLDGEDAVLSKEDFSRFQAMKSHVFAPDHIVVDSNLSGFEVMEHRLTDKIGTVFGVDHYKAVSLDESADMGTVIRHFVFPSPEERDICAIMHRLSYDEADRLAKEFVQSLLNEVTAYNAFCARIGVPMLNYKAEHHYSQLYNKHHIFTMTKDAVPFIIYVQQEKLTLRKVINIGLDIAAQLIKMRLNGSPYGTFTDNALFIGTDGRVYIDAHFDRLHERFYPYTTRTMYNRVFIPRAKIQREVYSLAMLLYRLLSGYNHTHINPHQPVVTNVDICSAESRRLAGERPIVPEKAYNILGTKLTEMLCASQREYCLEDIQNILENSLNYITVAELDSIIN